MSTPFQRTGEARNSPHISPLLRVALMLGVLAHLSGFFIFRVISNPLPSREERTAFIALVPREVPGDEAELIEQASLFDSAPLFVPGEWSSASRVFSTKILQDWQVFPDFEPSIELMDEVRPVRLSLPKSVDVQQPSDLLDLRFWEIFHLFGQEDVLVEKPQGWNSVVAVRVIGGNADSVTDFEMPLSANLEVERFAMRPIIFFLNMAGPGYPMSAPVLKQSSGFDALDAEALDWLTKPETLSKLPAGMLELRVFP